MMKYWAAARALTAATLAALVARAGDWTDSWDSIRAASQSVRSIEADFVQSRALAMLSRPIVSRGRLAFRRPADMRWEYQTPVQSVLLTRNGSPERYLRHDGRLVPDSSARLSAMSAVLGEINLWLSGDFSSGKIFRPELVHEGAKSSVRLVPLGPSLGKIIQSVTLRLGKTPGTVEAIVIDEGVEGQTSIEFSGVRINAPISDEQFAPR